MKYLGDPHIGKVFKTGVPLDKRGHREIMVMDQFRDELCEMDSDIHVCMGDLFDRFVINNADLLDVVDAYKTASHVNPDAEYYILAGNHDLSRDTTKVSSFDVFAELMASTPQVHVVRHKPQITPDGKFLLVPWDSIKTPVELLEDFRRKSFDAVFGHWDLDGDENVIPYTLLADMTDLVYTGHVHTPGEFVHSNGLKVIKTGSMQPYAHGEDPNEVWYITRTIETLNPDDYKGKCLRILVRSGDVNQIDVQSIQNDVLQLTFKAIQEEQEVDLAVGVDEFNLREVFEDVFASFNEKIREGVWAKISN